MRWSPSQLSLGLVQLGWGVSLRGGEPVSQGAGLVASDNDANGSVVRTRGGVRLRRAGIQLFRGKEPIQVTSELLRRRVGVPKAPTSVPHGSEGVRLQIPVATQDPWDPAQNGQVLLDFGYNFTVFSSLS